MMDSWAEKTKADIIAKYNSLGLKASGKFEKELETKEELTDNHYHAEFIGSSHSYFMVNGRGPNKQGYGGGGKKGELVEAIEKWVEEKPIIATDISKESLVFLISRKIAKQGIQVPNKYNAGTLLKPIDDNIKSLYNMIGDKIISDTKIQLFNGSK